MQEVAAERAGRGSVEFVAGHGVADARQMHADLMRASGPNANFEQSEFLEAAEHLVFGNRRAATRQFRSHADTAHGIASDRRSDFAPIRLHPAVYERQIDLF